MMSKPAAVVVSIAALSTLLMAQEPKPVPKDSVRIAIPGCTKGYVFTAGPRTLEEPGNFEIREGMHLRMNGPKKLMSEIKAHEGSTIRAFASRIGRRSAAIKGKPVRVLFLFRGFPRSSWRGAERSSASRTMAASARGVAILRDASLSRRSSG